MKNILLVEDEEVSRLFLSQFVSKVSADVTVIEACDGVEALRKFKENKIDLVITDIRMPNSDGCDLIFKIRQIDKEVPIIIESAHSEDFEECGDVSVDDIIVKPIRPADFKKVLDKYLI